MADFYKKISSMQGTVEQIVRRVPGFRGYFAREDRRMADRLLREKLAVVFGERLDEFGRLQKRLIDKGGVRYMERVRTIDSRLRTFVDKVRAAPSGYAGLFDAVRIDENALARVYAFDNALFDYEEQLVVSLRRLDETVGPDDVESVLSELERLADDVVDALGRRNDVLRGLQEAL